MDKKTVFVKTDKGQSEISGQSDFLFGDAKRILHLVDDDSTVIEITKRAPPSLRDNLQDTLQELLNGGYIMDISTPDNEKEKSTLKISSPTFKMSAPKGATSVKFTTPAKAAPSTANQPIPTLNKPLENKNSENKGSELDFSFIIAPSSSEKPAIVTKNIPTLTDISPMKPLAVEVAKVIQEEVQIDLVQRPKLDPEAKKAKLKTYDAVKERAKLEAAARARTEREAKFGKAQVVSNNVQAIPAKEKVQAAENKVRESAETNDAVMERAKLEAAAKARAESESKSIKESVASNSEYTIAEKARIQAAENKARESVGSNRGRTQIEANKALVQAEALAKAKAKLESEKLKEGKSVQVEAASKMSKLRAYEAAKEKAKIEVVTRARIEAEINLKKEADTNRLRYEQDASRAHVEPESGIKQDVEIARVKAERLRLELVATKARAEAEHRSRLEVEARAKAEIEARRQREADAERLRLEKERAELEVARIRAEAEYKLRQEAEHRLKAEMDARAKAEELSRQSERGFSNSNADVGTRTGKYDQVDSAQKLRESFVESFGQMKSKQKSDSSGFKLDTFSLIDTGKIAALTVPKEKPAVPPVGGSKVKAAIEARARKAAEAERLRAEQDAALTGVDHDNFAQLHSEQESAIEINTELEAKARIKAEQELYRMKVAQEQREKAELATEAEAKKLAEQQARQFEAAKRRAAVQEQAANERLARQIENDRIGSQQSRTRVSRKPLPIGKVFTGLIVLALLAIAGLPYVWPLDEYIAPLEKEISAQIKQPVHFKKMNFKLLPMPRLELHTVTMGKNDDLKVQDVVLNFDLSAMFAATRSINRLQLVNVSLSTASVDKILPWLQMAGGIEKYPVARIELTGVSIQNKDIELPRLNGLADFDPQGKFTNARLQSVDSKMSIELNAQDRLLQIELNLHDSNLPILPEIKFKDFSANGVIANNEIVFSDLFAHIYGGTLIGKAKLNWSSGWELQGQINVKSLEIKTLFPNLGISGELYGDVTVSMNGPTLPELDDTPRLDGSFEIKNGVVSKLDLETTARFGSRPGVVGHTDLSELAGTLKVNQLSQRYTLNSISAGATSGTGSIEVDEQHQLSGKFLVNISGVNAGMVPLKLCRAGCRRSR